MTNNVLQEIREALARLAYDNPLSIMSKSQAKKIGLEALQKLDAYIADNGWLPIESAPKDGTIIIVWHKNDSYMAQYNHYDKEWVEIESCMMLTPQYWQPKPLPPTGNTN